MSSPVPTGGAAAREDDASLREPLLANGDSGALATVVVANAHGGGFKAKDRYWEDVHEPAADAVKAADLESGSRRPLLFSNKKVKASLLYPYRCVRDISFQSFAFARRVLPLHAVKS
jgi:hypothetical protein